MGESPSTTDLEIFWNFDKVQKGFTLEDPQSASRSRPASRETFMARLFPLGTLKYFEILTKSKRWLRWKIRNRWVVLDLPVEKYRDRRVFRSDTFSKNFQSPKGDYAGTSAIGESFSTCQSRDFHGRVSSHCGLWNILKFWQSPKGDYAGISAIAELFSTCRSKNTAIGGSFSPTIFQKIFKVQKVITLEHPRSADPFGLSIGTRPRWANLFPLQTLKYFEILTKSKRLLRLKICDRRVVLDLPVERPS